MFDNLRRVFGHSVVYGSGEAMLLGVNFLLLPVFTRILTPADYGVLGLLLALRAFLRPLNQLGLDESFLRFHYDCDNDRERTLTGTTLVSIAAASGTVLVILLLGAPDVSRLLVDSTEHAGAVRLLALNGFLSAFLCVPHSLLRIRNQPLQFARWTIGGGLATVAGRLLFVVGLRMGVFGIMLADVIVSTLLLIGLMPVVGSLLVCRVSWSLARELLRYGLPRVPDTLLRQTMGMSDRFFLRAYLPLLDVGIYQVGTSVANVLKVLPEAFRRSWMPFAFETMAQQDAPRVFARMATAAFAVLVFAALCLVVFREPLIQVMTQAAFHGASEVVPMLTLGVAVHALSIFLTTSLNVTKNLRALPLATTAGAVITLVANVALIPRFGLMGAAGAGVAGATAFVTAIAYVAQRRYRIPYETGRLSRIALVGAILYATATLVPPDASLVGLVTRVAIVAAFPVALLLVGIVDQPDIDRVRALLAKAISRS